MRAGQLRHRIVIQRGSASQDTFGAETTTWSTLGTVWAEVYDLSGREYILSRQAQSEELVRITLRYRSDVTVANRVTWDGHVYDIKSVIQDPQKRMLQLMCAEVL